MTTVVLGIDPSLSCTGIGVATLHAGQVAVYPSTARSAGGRDDTLPQRHERIARLAHDVLVWADPPPALAVIEGVVSASFKGGSVMDRHHLWWRIVGGLIERGVPVAVVMPPTLKMAMTGSGRADKAAVAVAVERLWPGTEVSSSDVSDAVGLAHLGAVHLGWPVATLDRHRSAKVTWPELPEAVTS